MDILIHIGMSIEVHITETGTILMEDITVGLIKNSEVKIRCEPRGSISAVRVCCSIWCGGSRI